MTELEHAVFWMGVVINPVSGVTWFRIAATQRRWERAGRSIRTWPQWLSWAACLACAVVWILDLIEVLH